MNRKVMKTIPILLLVIVTFLLIFDVFFSKSSNDLNNKGKVTILCVSSLCLKENEIVECLNTKKSIAHLIIETNDDNISNSITLLKTEKSCEN